jgi:hypothetical protein
MRRIVWLGLMAVVIVLSGCHESAQDDSEAVATPTPMARSEVKQGEAAQIGGIQLTITKSEFSAPQLNIVAIVENKSDTPLTINPSHFTALDSEDTKGMQVSCGGKGSISGELKAGEKIETEVCWFVVGAKPPLRIIYEAVGRGKVTVALSPQ